MRFVAEKSALERVCGFVCPIADTKLNIPIVACVRIEVAKRVSLTATDLDIEIVGSLDAAIASPGVACLNAELFYNLVKCAPKGSQIEIELKNEQVIVRSGRSVGKLATLPVDGYPVRDLTKRFVSSFQIAGTELAELFDRVSFSVSVDRATRHYLCGINLSVRDGNLLAQATDTKVLARFVMQAPKDCAIDSLIIPTPASAVIKKLTGTSDRPVTVSIGETLIGAAAGDFSISSKLIDGSYPDCDRIIPQAGSLIVADREAIVSVLSNFSRLVERASDKERECIITFGNNEAEIVGRLPAGEFRDDVEVFYAGEPIRVCFNIANILASLSSIQTDQIELTGAAGSPWVVRGRGDKSGSLVVCSARLG